MFAAVAGLAGLGAKKNLFPMMRKWALLAFLFRMQILNSGLLDVCKTFRSTDFNVRNKDWRPYRESNPGYLREREVS